MASKRISYAIRVDVGRGDPGGAVRRIAARIASTVTLHADRISNERRMAIRPRRHRRWLAPSAASLAAVAAIAAVSLPGENLPSFAEAKRAADWNPPNWLRDLGGANRPVLSRLDMVKLDGGFSDDGFGGRRDAAEKLFAVGDAAGVKGMLAVPSPLIDDEFDPQPVHRRLAIGRGDTLAGLLLRAGIGKDDVAATIRALRPVYNPRRLKAGQDVSLRFSPDAESRMRFDGISLEWGKERLVTVNRRDQGGYIARAIDRALERQVAHGGGKIRRSLYDAGALNGVPRPVMRDLVRIFSFDVDFQRDIRAGDDFEILYERYDNGDARTARYGDILYASMTLSGKKRQLWRYAPRGGQADYFNEKGESVRKALMRTPINGARLSSRFGMRKHPILGYSRMHRGVDFAARRGTPIYAAGDGTIEKAGRQGGYGRYVRIRHNRTYRTAYAHLGRYAKGLRRGVKVRQGQVIGYVGSSGRSTGPHLHFEVLKGRKQINPMAMHLPSGQKLRGKELAAFQAMRDRRRNQLIALSSGNGIATLRPTLRSRVPEAQRASSE